MSWKLSWMMTKVTQYCNNQSIHFFPFTIKENTHHNIKNTTLHHTSQCMFHHITVNNVLWKPTDSSLSRQNLYFKQCMRQMNSLNNDSRETCSMQIWATSVSRLCLDYYRHKITFEVGNVIPLPFSSWLNWFCPGRSIRHSKNLRDYASDDKISRNKKQFSTFCTVLFWTVKLVLLGLILYDKYSAFSANVSLWSPGKMSIMRVRSSREDFL